MTDLDRQLQEIAKKNWEQFKAVMGEDAILRAKMCLLRQDKASLSQIAIRLNTTKRQAQYACENYCPGCDA